MSLPRRTEVARAFKQNGGMVAAVLPIHYPRALLRAFGILPMEVWGPPNVDPGFGTAHVQAYVCSIVRNALSFLHSDTAEVADLILVPHACDSLQGLGSLLLDFVQPKQPVIPFYLPRSNRAEGVQFLAKEFRSIYDRLEEITRRSPSDSELMTNIRREEAADVLLAQLHSERRRLDVSDYDFYRMIRSREFLPAEDFMDLAEQLRIRMGGERQRAIGVLLSGIVPEPMETLVSITKYGGMVVADDLACTGRRVYPPGESEDPFRRMAERILHAPPDWSLGRSIQSRMDYLQEKIHSTDAMGVIFYNVKFCEPELFDLPSLRNELDRTGIPSMTMEIDMNDPLSDQALMRLETFFEMIA
ncbi:MAG: 2-hydroxyacyl-CoA dehydratase subunit D [Anaerolineales bacterium]